MTPLRSQDGTVYGVLQVNRLNTGIENYTGFISVVAVLVFVIGAAGIVFSIWWGFRRHIERPLNRLLHVMLLVEDGDRSQRAAEDGPTEYRRLASGLNGMLDAMAEKIARLRIGSDVKLSLKSACANRKNSLNWAYSLRGSP